LAGTGVDRVGWARGRGWRVEGRGGGGDRDRARERVRRVRGGGRAGGGGGEQGARASKESKNGGERERVERGVTGWRRGG
jgi:hypothetical protein